MVNAHKLVALLAYAKANGRVCPAPAAWHSFWELLPREKGREAPVPLILGAWHFTDAEQKREVLREQIEYAARHGVKVTLIVGRAWPRGVFAFQKEQRRSVPSITSTWPITA
jgi:hypothetical protein